MRLENMDGIMVRPLVAEPPKVRRRMPTHSLAITRVFHQPADDLILQCRARSKHSTAEDEHDFHSVSRVESSIPPLKQARCPIAIDQLIAQQLRQEPSRDGYKADNQAMPGLIANCGSVKECESPGRRESLPAC